MLMLMLMVRRLVLGVDAVVDPNTEAGPLEESRSCQWVDFRDDLAP